MGKSKKDGEAHSLLTYIDSKTAYLTERLHPAVRTDYWVERWNQVHRERPVDEPIRATSNLRFLQLILTA